LIDETPAAAQAYDGALRAIRSAERTGRPLGAREFVQDLERRLGRPIARRGRGRKPAAPTADQPRLF